MGRRPDASSLGEFDVIARYFSGIDRVRGGAQAPRADVVLGIGDDAALLSVPADCELVAAVDTLVAGRHFPEGSAARSIGHRALAVNLSDLAAMGATPRWATLALTLPGVQTRWLEDFATGFRELAEAHDVALVGGDTTAGPLTLSVQILGTVARGTALRRTGARLGDVLMVTGTLGDAGGGLACVLAGEAGADPAQHLVRRFEYPTPRVDFGSAARGIATAAMDLSDGLTGDLPKLAAASGVGARVHVERLPLSAALRNFASPRQAHDWALAAGDDYELLLSVPRERLAELAALAAGMSVQLTAIGEIRPGNAVEYLLDGHEFAAPPPGYDHFR